ncbi:hypothetical protein STEG23_029289 [Scotinomys teguina]
MSQSSPGAVTCKEPGIAHSAVEETEAKELIVTSSVILFHVPKENSKDREIILEDILHSVKNPEPLEAEIISWYLSPQRHSAPGMLFSPFNSRIVPGPEWSTNELKIVMSLWMSHDFIYSYFTSKAFTSNPC